MFKIKTANGVELSTDRLTSVKQRIRSPTGDELALVSLGEVPGTSRLGALIYHSDKKLYFPDELPAETLVVDVENGIFKYIRMLKYEKEVKPENLSRMGDSVCEELKPFEVSSFLSLKKGTRLVLKDFGNDRGKVQMDLVDTNVVGIIAMDLPIKLDGREIEFPIIEIIDKTVKKFLFDTDASEMRRN